MKDKELFVINAIILVIFVSVVSMGIKKEHTAHAYFIEEGRQIKRDMEETEEFTLIGDYKDFILVLDDDHKYLSKLNEEADNEIDEPEETDEETNEETNEEAEVVEEFGGDDVAPNNEDTSTETDHETRTINSPSNHDATNRPVQTEVNDGAGSSIPQPEKKTETTVVTEPEQPEDPDVESKDEETKDTEGNEEIEEKEKHEENENEEEEEEKKEKEPLK